MLEVNPMLFTHGKRVGNIGISHKWVGHVSWWKNKILLEVFPNLEQKRWC
jgi:hypothetical protein